MRSQIQLILPYFLWSALVVGGLFLWSQQQQLAKSVSLTSKVDSGAAKVVTSPIVVPETATVTSPANLSALEASVAALLRRVDQLEKTKTATSQVTPVKATASKPSFQKETLYLGSATTTKNDWTKTGLQLTINANDYPSNVRVFLEAGLSIVSGEVSVRLINKTTGAVISASELTHGTSTVTWKSSPGFKFHPNTNTYEIELRSSSGEVANLAGARVIIDL